MACVQRSAIGVEMNMATIKVCKLNSYKDSITNLTIPSPNPFIPGAVTVELCDAVTLIDSNLEAKIIGVSLGASLDSSRRTIKYFKNIEGWIDVPFADWLEVRLSREVVLLENHQSLIRRNDIDSKIELEDKSAEMAKEAALFACKKFSGLDSLS